MSTRREIMDLADGSLTARQIAQQLNVSRQWVYLVVKEEGLPLAQAGNLPRYGSPRCVPKVQTGGIVQPVNTTTAGTISEMLVAADLLARGWQVYMPLVRNRGHDLIACKGNKALTVEVRSARRLESGKVSYHKDWRDCSDIYALVLTGEPVRYEPEIDSAFVQTQVLT